MKLRFTKRFRRAYARLPERIRAVTDKQLGLLLSNPDHPSLNMKKMQGAADIWEARVTKSFRLTFQVDGDVFTLRNIGPHDILNNP